MIEVDLRPKYDFLKYKNILPVPILGRLSRLQVVEIGGELNLAAKEAIFGGGSIMSWEVRLSRNVRCAG